MSENRNNTNIPRARRTAKPERYTEGYADGYTRSRRADGSPQERTRTARVSRNPDEYAGARRASQSRDGNTRAYPRSGDYPRSQRAPQRAASSLNASNASNASNTSRTGGANPPKSGAPKPSAFDRALGALKRACLFVAGIFTGFYHLFDRFRTSESKRVVTNALLAGALVFLLACAFMLLRPSLLASRAVSKAEQGDAAEAMQLLSKAEKEGLGASRLDKARLEISSAFIDQGSYALARQLAGEMSDASAADAQNAKADYAEASGLYAERSFASAAQLFYRLGSYKDSADRYGDCLCAIAVTAYIEGSEARARSLLAELDDAESRLPRVCAYMGRAELANDPLFSAESLKHMRESYALLKQSRQATQKGNIAAGARHSLVLRQSGNVLAKGDNSRGQCDVSSWSGITMLAAGAFHSVGLKADGTVVACGDNSEGQCNVASWRDITAIAAGAYTTVGLKRDGGVVYCGRGVGSMGAWQDVQLISAGGYSVGALTGSSAMLSSHGAALLPPDVKMFELAVCGPVSVGILYDGSLISSLKDAPDWRDLKSVAVSETGVFALTLEGAVKAEYFRASDALNIKVASGAVELAASASHVLVLMSDGRVYAFGDDTYGQCGVHNTVR